MSDSDEEIDWVDSNAHREPKKPEPTVSRPADFLTFSKTKAPEDDAEDEEGDELDSFLGAVSVAKQRKGKTNKPRAPTFEPCKDSRELNPYWKNGGTGLPEESAAKQEERPQAVNVGDSGATWFRRALQRCEQQAREEGRSLEEVAAERWGSLDRLYALINGAEKSGSSQQRRAGTGRHDDRQVGKYSHRDNRGTDERDFRKREPADSGYYRRRDTEERREHDRSERDHNRDRGHRHDDDDRRRDRERDRHDSHRHNADNHSTARHHSGLNDDRQNSATTHRGADSEQQGRSSARAIDDHNRRTQVADSERESRNQNAKSSDKPDTSAPTSSATESMTEADLNKLNARLLRAELGGNTQQAAALRAQIEAIKQRNAAKSSDSSSVTESSHKMESSANRNQKDSTERSSGGKWKDERDRLNTELKQMARQERCLTSSANERMYSRQQGAARDAEDEYEEGFAQPSTSKSEQDASRNPKKQKVDSATKYKFSAESVRQLVDADSIRRFKLEQKEMARCSLCLEKATKHLIVSQGAHAYLSVTAQDDVTENQCVIAPNDHVDSLLKCVSEPGLIAELGEYRRAVRSMFSRSGNECVFLEHSVHGRHASIECVPLDSGMEYDAEMYFRKAILETGSEWAQNRKLVPFGADPELTGASIRRALPRDLAYFAVYFSDGRGYAHVIDDPTVFPQGFGFEVLSGLFELDALQLRAKRNKKMRFEELAAKCMRFTKNFSKYDPHRDSNEQRGSSTAD